MFLADHRVKMRICVRTSNGVTRREKGGKVVYEGNERILRWMDIWDAMFDNNTFSFSKKDYALCHERITSNESDITTEWYTPSDNETSFCVPTPNKAEKIGMLAGYDLADITKKDVASALLSYQLLDNSVYLGALVCFLALLLLAISVRLFNHYRELQLLNMLQMMDGGLRYEELRVKKKKITRKGYSRHLVKKQVSSFIRGSDHGSRWVSLLITILSFYLLIYFCSVYSTSKIILKSPEIVDTYQKLIQHDTAVGYFDNFMLKASASFENSSAGSDKRKVWMKYLSARKPMEMKVPEKLRKGYKLMRDDRSVIIGSSTILRWLKPMFCAASSEGQLRHMELVFDPSEEEKIYGFPVAIHLKQDKKVTLKLRLMQESGCPSALGEWSSQHPFNLVKQKGITSGEHLFKQKLVCDNELMTDVDAPDPVDLPYWLSLIHALLAIHLLAFIVSCIEKLIA